MKKKIFRGLLILLIAIQLVPYSIKNEETVPSDDFFAINEASLIITSTIRASCYGCHSQEAKKPWYAYVAPVKFWLNKHVRGGRMHLDFSNWGQLSGEDRQHTIKEIQDEINSHAMPLSSYLWLHTEAKLTDQQRDDLVIFFNSIN